MRDAVDPVPQDTQDTAHRIIGCALRVHRRLGPGLYESIYETCLARELAKARLSYEEQVSVTITYDGESLPAAFRADLIVERRVIVEIKSVEHVLPVHDRQVLTYLKLSGIRKGLLINFNVPMLKQGIKSFAL